MIGHIQNRHLYCANKSNHYSTFILSSSNKNLRRKGPDKIQQYSLLDQKWPILLVLWSTTLGVEFSQPAVPETLNRGSNSSGALIKKKIHLKNLKWPLHMEEMLILSHNQRNESVFYWHKIIAGKDVQQQELHTSKWECKLVQLLCRQSGSL